MSEDTTTHEDPTLSAGQIVAIPRAHDSEFAGLRAIVEYAPDENNAGAVVRVEYPGHTLHGWTLDIEPEHLVTSGKLVDSRYVFGVSEVEDDMTDEEWAAAFGPSPELLARWNAESLTGGVAEGAQSNATVDEVRVIAVYVEDDQSDEYARTFECFFPDGSVDHIAEDDIELDDDSADEVSDGYRDDPASCIADGVHLTSTDDDGYCNACGHQPDTTEQAG